jgi:hypothetical protein
MSGRRTVLYSLLICVFLLLSLSLYAQQQPDPTFEPRHYADGATRVHADLNNDGREDMLTINSRGDDFQVHNSTGDGTYGAAVSYQVPDGQGVRALAVADLNGDGWADIIAVNGTAHLYEFLNNGDGTFHLQRTWQLSLSSDNVLAGDFNHDGRVDIAFLTNDGSGHNSINVWFSNGDGSFTPGPTTSNNNIGYEMILGDFDGDGKADIATKTCDFSCTLFVHYGDNTGHFTTVVNTNGSGANYYRAGDLNHDGRTDLIGATYLYSTSGFKWYQRLYELDGNSNRTFTPSTIPTNHCVANQPMDAADLNGDGSVDIAFLAYADCDGSYPMSVVTMVRGNGPYQADKVVYTAANNGALNDLSLWRSDRNSKPDIAVTELPSNDTNLRNLVDLINTTSWGVLTCDPPNAYTGINVCSPGSTSGTSASFIIGAAGQTPMHKIELWVDGKKLDEEFYGWSNYASMMRSENLTAGTHKVTVYAAGWDNWLEKKSFTLTVGSGGGCTASSATTVAVCSPPNGSTQASPVHFDAVGGSSVNYMELWVGGVKKFQTSSNHLATDVALNPGTYAYSVYGKVNGTTTDKKTGSVVVSGSSGCTPSSSGGVAICSPAAGSTVSSPVDITANGGSAVTWMEVWVDGAKAGQGSGHSINIRDSLPAGSHTLTVYGKVNGSVSGKATETFNVH